MDRVLAGRRRGGYRWLGTRRVAAALAVLLWSCLLAAPVPTLADGAPADILRQVGFDQHLNSQVPLDLTFRDETGRAVRLGDYFAGKPVILTLNYYTCPNLCSLVLNGLVTGLNDLSFDLGDQYSVVTVSIDPGDTPATASAKKSELLTHYARPGGSGGWHFLTGEAGAIAQLAGAVGFRYAYDARQRQYAHPSGIMILTPAGHIARYLYGIEYPSRDLRLGLVEAAANRIGSPGDRLLLLCYHYDPVTGRYRNVIDAAIKVVGLGGALALGTLVLVMLRQERRAAGRVAP